jgi:hypothetical protein
MSEKDGGLLKKIKNLNNLLTNMELEIGKESPASLKKELMYSAYIDGKKFLIRN